VPVFTRTVVAPAEWLKVGSTDVVPLVLSLTSDPVFVSVGPPPPLKTVLSQVMVNVPLLVNVTPVRVMSPPVHADGPLAFTVIPLNVTSPATFTPALALVVRVSRLTVDGPSPPSTLKPPAPVTLTVPAPERIPAFRSKLAVVRVTLPFTVIA